MIGGVRINIDLCVNDYNRDLYAVRKQVFELRPNESFRHLVMKVLGLALHYDDRLLVEPPINDRYKPDLMMTLDDGRPGLWIECGQCRVSKLDKLTFRHYDADVVVIQPTERRAREIMERCVGEVRRLNAITFIGFDAGFVDDISDRMIGKNDISVILSDNEIQLVIAGLTFSSRVHRFVQS